MSFKHSILKFLLNLDFKVPLTFRFESGHFQEVIDDAAADAKKVERVLFCSGKIYYELLEKKEELNAEEVAIVRQHICNTKPAAKFCCALTDTGA